MNYKNTKTNRLFQRVTKKEIKDIWILFGYSFTAKHFDTSIGVIRSIVSSEKWQRPAELCPNIYYAVQNGTKTEQDFPHLDFSGELFKQFFSAGSHGNDNLEHQIKALNTKLITLKMENENE